MHCLCTVYVFSIDIPFKGSQNLLNMRSKVTVVLMTQLYHGHCSVQPNQSYAFKKTVLRIIREDIRQSWLQRAVNGTTVACP
jgi:hypothetical protein